MKKFVIVIILCLISIISYGQHFVIKDNKISVWDAESYKDTVYNDISKDVQFGSAAYIARTQGYLPAEIYTYDYFKETLNFDFYVIFTFKLFTTEIVAIFVHDKDKQYDVSDITNDFISKCLKDFSYDKEFDEYDIKYINENSSTRIIRESYVKSLDTKYTNKYDFTFNDGKLTYMSKKTDVTKFKLINKNVEIVKPIWFFENESRKSSLVNEDETFVHIKIDSFGEAGNLVQYWIEQNGTKFNKHLAEDVMVINMPVQGHNGYVIADDDFIYMFICETEMGWQANFVTNERN